MKLLVPLPLRRRLRQAATRRFATTTNSNSNKLNGVPTEARGSLGTTPRVRRGTDPRAVDPRAKDMEMDSLVTRIMGSDWGDRSKQPVSMAMRIYWGIFIIVLANGAYTYFAGKDEKFLVEKVQKKVDEKLGRVETNEFVVMADQQNTSGKPSETPSSLETEESPAAAQAASSIAKDPDFSLADSPPKSVFSSKAVPTPMPYFGAPVPHRGNNTSNTKADYERQLQQLRQRQAHAREERTDPSRFRSTSEIDLEIKRIDQQKAQLKQLLKKL